MLRRTFICCYSAFCFAMLWGCSVGNPAEQTINVDVSSFGYCPPEYLRKYMSPQYPFLEIDGKPCFFRVYDGLIYRFDMEACTLIPFIAWNLGEYQCELRHIPEDLDVREYYDFILRQSHKRISPFFSMKSIGNMLLANVIFNELTYTLCYNSDTGTTFLFDKTSENMKVLAELTYGTVMYKFIDAHSLPEYVNREILSPASRTIYDNIIAEDSSAIIKYSL